MIRSVLLSDAPSLTAIYNPFIRTSTATFEEVEISEDEMERRIKSIHFEQNYPFIVYEEDGVICGYAYASKFRERYSYRFTTESTVYLDPAYFGRGIGKKLYRHLIEELKQGGFHSVMGVITLPNDPSVQLHEQMGFKKAGHFTEVGFKFNKWLDVGY